MDKSEFINKTVSMLFSLKVQSAIAIENYHNATIGPFNRTLMKDYKLWCKLYDKAIKEFDRQNLSEDAQDALLISHIREQREKMIKTILLRLKDEIISRNGVKYDIQNKFSEYDDNRNIKNPFECIIIDIRHIEEKQTEALITEMGGESMANKEKLLWFSEEDKQLYITHKKTIEDEDGELGGHMSYNNVIEDMSYWPTTEDQERLFNKDILGVI